MVVVAVIVAVAAVAAILIIETAALVDYITTMSVSKFMLVSYSSYIYML